MVSINYGFPKGKYFAVIAESKYNQGLIITAQDSQFYGLLSYTTSLDFRSLAKAAAKRAGFAGIIVMGRNVASTMICPDNNIESDHVYLELHLKKNSLDIAIMLKDEDGIFETLANQRLNYTASGLGILSMLSSTLDELARNAEIPDNTIVHQVIITSANPLTVSHHQAVQHLQAFLKSHLKSSNLVFCEGHATDDDNTIPYEYRIAFGAAKYSSLIAREQLEGGHFICCVELSPVHYGIAVAGGMMHPIIRRHSIEDGPKSAVFTTILPQKQQKSIEIAVYRGMRLQTAFNAHVGSLHVQNDGSLSLLNITIQVNHHSDELILTVQDLTTESIASLTFVNDKQTIAAEVEQFEKTWGPEQFDLSRTLDQQLKDNVDLVVSMYAVTANDTLQETLFKKLRYMFLARWKREQITDLLSRSDSRLIPNNREKGTFLAIDLN
ncbi:uncharacterized protein ATC70_009109 [Mucor velutinosus]|uniref:Uncharacterized protein n=1 Tax=Mucor velutinosus TaxID=708070 RepID=A0AAN7HPA9_9FUNG|nr:hypothetical protein ATC70_009109 [Mucor velutinosus]